MVMTVTGGVVYAFPSSFVQMSLFEVKCTKVRYSQTSSGIFPMQTKYYHESILHHRHKCSQYTYVNIITLMQASRHCFPQFHGHRSFWAQRGLVCKKKAILCEFYSCMKFQPTAPYFQSTTKTCSKWVESMCCVCILLNTEHAVVV